MTGGYLRRDVCPLCGAAAELAALHVQSNPPAESLPFDDHRAFTPGYASERVFFSYRRCSRCGGVYCPVYLTQEQLDRLYSHQSENMAEVPLPAREATQRGYFALFNRHEAPKGEYLEVGPDIGLFAGLCAARGHFTRFHLYEPNVEVHGTLATRLDGQELTVTTERYRPGTLARSSVAAAIAIHVLDHLIEPAELLHGFWDDLAPGGLLFLVTHNEASLLARVLGRRWPPYTPQHPQLFSPATITKLLERCGFELLEIIGTQNYFPVTHLVRAAFSVAGLGRHAPAFDRPFSIGLRLGNIATIARKPG